MKTMLRACGCLLVAVPLIALSQQETKPSPDPKPQLRDPVLVKRPPAGYEAIEAKEGRIHLDVIVTDAAGKLVSGLTAKDFTLLDDNRAQQIVSFRSFDGRNEPPVDSNGQAHNVDASAEPPTEIILVIDTLNAGFAEVSFTRDKVEKFLEKSGHLTQPISILLLADNGFVARAGPSADGKALAKAVHSMQTGMHTINAAQGASGALEQLQRSVRSVALIANNAVKRPGRKLLIWTGPGWPTLRGESDIYSARGHQLNFETIISLSTSLREAQMEICSAGGGSEFYVRDYMKGIRTAKQANSGNLALPILAVQSGGMSLNGGNHGHPEDQIKTCLADADAYYRISFDPPKSTESDEYHDLKVRVAKPGLTARTNTGYYDQP